MEADKGAGRRTCEENETCEIRLRDGLFEEEVLEDMSMWIFAL